MKEYKIQLILSARNEKMAKEVADEAQALIDRYGSITFLRLVDYMKRNPGMVDMALNMI